VSRPEPNEYRVRVTRGANGWEVRILSPAGGAVFERACGSEAEARTFASTVRQHIFWLSPGKFREYYRIPG
jgi:hypothetical protein